MSMQVTDTISYINTSNNSVNSPVGGSAGGGEQYNHLSRSNRWSRLTLLEKRLAILSGVLFVIVLILLIIVIVQASKK